jgi:hypothetical protein
MVNQKVALKAVPTVVPKAVSMAVLLVAQWVAQTARPTADRWVVRSAHPRVVPTALQRVPLKAALKVVQSAL